MNTSELAKEIDLLDVSEKVTLVEDIWDSIAHDNVLLPMPEWQKSELDKRYSEYQGENIKLYDWKDVHKTLRERHV